VLVDLLLEEHEAAIKATAPIATRAAHLRCLCTCI